MTPRAINHKAIRAENRKKVLALLQKQRELTLQEIAKELDLSVPTVTTIVEQLTEEGFAQNAGVSVSVAGRRPKVIQFAPDAYDMLAVEFTLDAVRIVLTNLDAEIKAEATINAPDYQQMDALMEAIRQETERMMAAHAVRSTHVLGIGFSLPGVVDEERGVLKIAPNLGLKQVDFAQYAPLFPFPMFLENEANAAAMAELKLGVAKEMRNLVYVSVLSEGIGTGIIVGGQLYRGKNKRAGEYGHTNIMPHGLPCSCGRRGCWERYASGNALLHGYAERTGAALRDLSEFFARLSANDEAAAAIFETYLDYLAIGIQDILLAQDPHYIYVGGVLSPFKEQILEPLQQRVFVENMFYTQQDVAIRWTTLQANASILGAALLSCERMFHSSVTT